MLRSLSHASRWLTAAALVAAPAISMAQADNRPVVDRLIEVEPAERGGHYSGNHGAGPGPERPDQGAEGNAQRGRRGDPA